MSTINDTKNRAYLKELFIKGKVPTEEHFTNVFDSFLNFQDDKIEKDDSANVIKFKSDIVIGDAKQASIAVNDKGNLTINDNIQISNSGNIKGVAAGIDPQDAVNKTQLDNTLATSQSYVDSKTWLSNQITDLNATIVATRLNSFASPTTFVNMNNNRISNLAEPAGATDAANKNYVDTKFSSIGDIDIDKDTKSQLPISRLEQPVADGANKYLRGDGNWKNIEGFVKAPSTSTVGNILTFDNTTGNLVKDSGVKVANDTIYTNNIASPTGISGIINIPSVIEVTGSTLFNYTAGARIYGILNTGPYFPPENMPVGAKGTFSINVKGNILAAYTCSHSSKTIKNIDVNLSKEQVQQEALDLINQISIKKYAYKDILKYSDGANYGVIAEEAATIIPYIVHNSIEYVPNLMIVAKLVHSPSETKLIISDQEKFEQFLTEDFKREKIRFYIENHPIDSIITTIESNEIYISMINNDICQIEIVEGELDVFVYGTFENCPAVDKDKLFEMNIAVTQNLIKRVEELEAKLAALPYFLECSNQGKYGI